MSPFTICTYLCNGHDRRALNVLSIFLHPVSFNEALMDEALVPLLTNKGPFDCVRIHGAPEPIAIARDIFQNESAVRARLSKTLEAIDEQVVFITWAASHCENFVA